MLRDPGLVVRDQLCAVRQRSSHQAASRCRARRRLASHRGRYSELIITPRPPIHFISSHLLFRTLVGNC